MGNKLVCSLGVEGDLLIWFPPSTTQGANAPLLIPANVTVLKSRSSTDHIISTPKSYRLFSQALGDPREIASCVN